MLRATAASSAADLTSIDLNPRGWPSAFRELGITLSNAAGDENETRPITSNDLLEPESSDAAIVEDAEDAAVADQSEDSDPEAGRGPGSGAIGPLRSGAGLGLA